MNEITEITEKLLTSITENQPKIYANGVADGIEQGKQEVISNSKYIEKTASGKVIRLDDVSEVAHKVKVKADTPTEVKVCGKNLFNNDISLVKKVSYRDSKGNSSRKNGYEIHLPAGDYTATLISQEDISNVYWYGVINDANGNFVRNVILNQSTSNRTPLSFSINEGDVLYWYDGIGDRTIQNSWNLCLGLCQVQLEVGSGATPYESYKEPQTITATPNGAEVSSICPIMTFLADNDVTVDYYSSYGMQTEYDRFWDVFQQNGERRYYSYCFTGVVDSSAFWNEQNFRPKYDIILSTSVNASDSMFLYSPIKNLEGHLDNLGIKLDTSQAPRLNGCFDRSKITHAPPLDMSSCKEMIRVFYLVTTLKKATLLNIREDCVFTNPFSSCRGLEELIVTGTIGQNINLQWSTKLTLESLLSLINCLKNFNGSTEEWTKTITLSTESWDLLKAQGNIFSWADMECDITYYLSEGIRWNMA